MLFSMMRSNALAALCLLGSLCVSTPSPAAPNDAIVRISGSTGGHIGDFMARLHHYRSQGSRVQFSGSCDSACTLLLALPRANTCITKGAVFRFHAPTAVSVRTSMAAKRYMMAQYPAWVRNWISRNNGLTARLISMDYGYASKFMRTCQQVV